MKIIVIGTGYVGLVHAAVCSEYGHDVFAHDIDREKIEAFSIGQPELIEKYVNEPGLVNIIRETLSKSLHFSHDLEAIIEGTDAIFMCLPTPSNIDGSTNSRDRFPLVNPIIPNEIDADAGEDVIININQTVIFNGTKSTSSFNCSGLIETGPSFVLSGSSIEKCLSIIFAPSIIATFDALIPSLLTKV